MTKLAKKFAIIRGEQGLSTVEYIIILGMIAFVGVAAWHTFDETPPREVGEAGKQTDVVN